MAFTDITVEVFNRCAGSCTGCLLSVAERRDERPVMPIHELAAVAEGIAAYGCEKGLRYRAVLVFGDLPSMPISLQRRYYEACVSAGLGLGVTMTLVDDGREEAYRDSLRLILETDPAAIFDITIDPVRLEREEGYSRRVAAAANMTHVHLQMLLSEAVMQRWSPEALAALASRHLSGKPISLGFTPSLSNLERRNYAYDVTSAAHYAARFYNHTPEGRDHFTRELERFRSAGSYGDFVGQTFHVSPGGFIHAVAYTIFGDVILDGRNLGKPLGTMLKEDLGSILSGRVSRRLSAMNEAWIGVGEFGCDTCVHLPSCTFSGVGLTRMIYRGHESKIGSCYGPASISAAA